MDINIYLAILPCFYVESANWKDPYFVQQSVCAENLLILGTNHRSYPTRCVVNRSCQAWRHSYGMFNSTVSLCALRKCKKHCDLTYEVNELHRHHLTMLEWCISTSWLLMRTLYVSAEMSASVKDSITQRRSPFTDIFYPILAGPLYLVYLGIEKLQIVK